MKHSVKPAENHVTYTHQDGGSLWRQTNMAEWAWNLNEDILVKIFKLKTKKFHSFFLLKFNANTIYWTNRKTINQHVKTVKCHKLFLKVLIWINNLTQIINLYGGWVYYPLRMLSNVLLTYSPDFVSSMGCKGIKVFLASRVLRVHVQSGLVKRCVKAERSKARRMTSKCHQWAHLFCRLQICLPAWSARLRWQPSNPICQRDVLLVCDQLLAPISGSLSFPLRTERRVLTARRDIPLFMKGQACLISSNY